MLINPATADHSYSYHSKVFPTLQNINRFKKYGIVLLPPLPTFAFSVQLHHFSYPKLPCITVTVNVSWAVFPDGSVKVYVTWVLPTGKNELGELVLEVKVAVPELSVAEGSSQLTMAPFWVIEMVTVISSKGEITGGVVSTETHKQKGLCYNFILHKTFHTPSN